MVCPVKPAKVEFTRDVEGRIHVAVGLGKASQPVLLKGIERREHPRVDGNFRRAEDAAYIVIRKM
jgi:hypothetical protein